MGDSKLPNRQDMIADTKEELRRLTEEEGFPERHFHRFGKRQWPYNDDIAKLANEVRTLIKPFFRNFDA